MDFAKAEGFKKATVLRAEGESEARVKVAEAEAEAISTTTTALTDSHGDPASYLIAVRYIETLREMVSGKDNKVVYLPFEATGVLGSLGLIKEMFSSNSGSSTSAKPISTQKSSRAES
jgi:regulator of protease activity HflC (stomatin/prohibitin superfamily)